jgi:mevalonate kinase
LGVSCTEIETIVEKLKGNYHSKLTGAGAGGCVIGFKIKGSISNEEFRKKLEEDGFSIFEGIHNSQKGMMY